MGECPGTALNQYERWLQEYVRNHFERYRQIADVLARHGLDFLLG